MVEQLAIWLISSGLIVFLGVMFLFFSVLVASIFVAHI